jgi:hypothetical protein
MFECADDVSNPPTHSTFYIVCLSHRVILWPFLGSDDGGGPSRKANATSPRHYGRVENGIGSAVANPVLLADHQGDNNRHHSKHSLGQPTLRISLPLAPYTSRLLCGCGNSYDCLVS